MTTTTHTKGTTIMTTITYKSPTEEVVSFLRASIKEGIIYNSDFTVVKEILSHRFDADERAVRDHLYKGRRTDGLPGFQEGVSEILDALPMNLYGLKPKALIVLQELTPKLVNNPAFALNHNWFFETLKLVTFWLEVRELLYVTAKPLIVKTRKPNPDSESKDARTLENTGTCPICNGNFKRDSKGRIVRHGYKVEGREYHGSCYGDGFQPWEVSSTGVEKYLTLLERTKCSLENQQSSLLESPPESLYDKYRRVSVAKGEAGYERLLLSRQADVASQLRQVASDLQYFTKKLHNWTPGTLPGILAGFDK